jgi:hypothetical protein
MRLPNNYLKVWEGCGFSLKGPMILRAGRNLRGGWTQIWIQAEK